MPGQEDVAHDFGLLLKAITVESPAAFDTISVAAKGVAHQRQVKAAALLRLEHMGHFVDEQAHQSKAARREIVRPERAFGVEVYVACRGHDHMPWLERPPFAADEAHSIIVYGASEDRTGKLDFALRKGAGAFHCKARGRRPPGPRRDMLAVGPARR